MAMNEITAKVFLSLSNSDIIASLPKADFSLLSYDSITDRETSLVIIRFVCLLLKVDVGQVISNDLHETNSKYVERLSFLHRT